jgi:hypothetical protein
MYAAVAYAPGGERIVTTFSRRRQRVQAGVASRAVRPIASRVLGSSEATARNRLVHCTQEMNHHAGFLSELYDAFGNE